MPVTGIHLLGMTFAEKLRILRTLKGLGQEEFGKLIGLSESQYRKQETGRAKGLPKAEVLGRLVELSGEPMSYWTTPSARRKRSPAKTAAAAAFEYGSIREMALDPEHWLFHFYDLSNYSDEDKALAAERMQKENRWEPRHINMMAVRSWLKLDLARRKAARAVKARRE